MARASTYTWLPLDTWAKHMGYDPWLFNGFSQFPNTIGDECADIWMQEPGQYQTLSREELASAIKEAENVLSEYIGYKLLPTWDWDIIYPTPYYSPGYVSDLNSYGRAKSVKIKDKYLIQLGAEVRNYLQTVGVVRVDLDNDGFAETGRVTIAETTLDPNQVRFFYPDQDGDEGWEIRPVKSKGSGIYEFQMYQVPHPDLMLPPVVDPIDPADTNSYITEVDVYQVYNDIDEPITLYFDNSSCADCSELSLNGCGSIEQHKLGYVKYNPTFQSATCCNTEPDRIRIKYLSGWQGRVNRPLLDLDNFWHLPITYLAPSYFNRPVVSCCGGQTSNRITEWTRDIRSVVSNGEAMGGFVTGFVLENPFGLLTTGAWYAYSKIRTKRL